MSIFKKAADSERRRINEALSKATPGSEQYDKLLKERAALEDIEAKRRDGTVKAIDIFKFVTTAGTTAAVMTADRWIPTVERKLRLTEMAKKLISK